MFFLHIGTKVQDELHIRTQIQSEANGTESSCTPKLCPPIQNFQATPLHHHHQPTPINMHRPSDDLI